MKVRINRRINVKYMKFILITLAILPTLALASGAPTPEVIRDNAGLFQWVLGIALLGNGIFINRTLKSIDRLWARTDKFERRLSRLEGSHNTNHRSEDKDED